MADKNIKLKDASSNYLFPQTKAGNVLTSDGTGNLGTVAPGAQVNVIETIKVNGTNQTVTSKAVDISVPVAYDSVTAPTGYINKTQLDAAIAAAPHMKRQIVETLPTEGQDTNTIYMVPKTTAAAQNVYNEFMWINSAWELIGSSEIDLSSYATLASPTFTGTPAAPTAAAGTSTTQLATTAFVANAIAGGISYEEIV